MHIGSGFIGGRIEEGETIHEAFERECLEEIGYTVSL